MTKRLACVILLVNLCNHNESFNKNKISAFSLQQNLNYVLEVYNTVFRDYKEYLDILKAIKRLDNVWLYLIVESISGAGLKLSELQYLTVEAVIKSRVELPTNHRSIYLPKNLRDDLLEYCKENDVFIGAILVTKSGKVPDKANISRELKSICADAGVDPERLSTKTLRDYYLKSFEDHRKEVVEMMDRERRKTSVAL